MSAEINLTKINSQKMCDLADYLKSAIPGCGFALIAFEVDEYANQGNYISNVQDDFMISTLERQLKVLKAAKTYQLSNLQIPEY
ncbi:hypothetical protein [Mucilaginibacter sp. CSA2-8R]|uniref:hypothetical protein n=1 Tax=Mucilaginibacter sp. CSA2-8R TaxID=3141542 RepID=UPI00315CA8D1